MVAEDSAEHQPNDASCRILVIGLHRKRVTRVLSIIQQSDHEHFPDHYKNKIEFLGCVAKFGEYQSEETHKMIRYLASVDVISEKKSSSSSNLLIGFFDHLNTCLMAKENTTTQPCAFGVVIIDTGSSIVRNVGDTIAEAEDDNDDVVKIKTFVRSMISSCQDSECMPKVVAITPNPEFSSIQEELEYFKELPEEEKNEATRRRTLGPGKMAKFVIDVAKSLLDRPTEKQSDKHDSEDSSSMPSPHFGLEPIPPRIIDPNKTRYCCRMCRCILFGQDDLEDPPHIPSRHHFSHRKHNIQQSQEICQSYFLQERLDFMMPPTRSSAGDEAEEAGNGAAEGKFGCPKCHTKLGSWHLYGAQCSCGTWVVPAIQIPQSKVDPISPSPPIIQSYEPTIEMGKYILENELSLDTNV